MPYSREGLKTFAQGGAAILARHFLRTALLRRICGKDADLPCDLRWPDTDGFPPANSLSAAAREGKPTICLATANMSAGGAQRQVVALACTLTKRGYDVRVRVMNLDGENGHYLPFLKARGVDISVPRVPTLSDVGLMRERGADIALIRHLPPELRVDAAALALDLLARPADVVHCYLDWSCCYGGFAALLGRVPCVRFSWRNLRPVHFEFYREWMPLLYRRLLRHPNVVAESNTRAGANDYAQWLGLSSGAVAVIPNGIFPEMYLADDRQSPTSFRERIGLAAEAPLVLCVGRLLPQKRPLDIPDILSALRKRVPAASLVHAGAGPLRRRLEERAAAAGLYGPRGDGGRGPMVLLGRRDNVQEMMRAADAFLLTSEREGMPNALMEAMFAGVAVVSTRAGGVAELVQDGVHGYLHDVGDIGGMAGSLERLLGDPALRRRFGTAGQKLVLAEFSAEHLADRVTRAYALQCSSAVGSACDGARSGGTSGPSLATGMKR